MENGRKYIVTGAVLTAAILIITAGWLIWKHYSYGKEWADYTEIYGTGEGAAVFLDDTLTSWRALRQDGQVYLSAEMVKEELNDRFYLSLEGKLLYTLPEETVEVAPGQKYWRIGGVRFGTEWPVCLMRGEQLYIAAEYVERLTDVHITAYTDPERVLITRGGAAETWAQVTKKAQVRSRAGRKELILTEVEKGDAVCLLETGEDWSRVRTESGFIGYLPAKVLGETSVRTRQSEAVAQDYTGTAAERPVRLVWHQLFAREANDLLPELLEETSGITVLAPTWFALSNEEGGFTSCASAGYVEEAHSRGIQVWALINDFNTAVDKYALLSRTASRRALIANLIRTAEEYELDGLNIDFEQIDRDTGEHFVQFIRELSVECRKRGLVLSVDNYSPVGGRTWYDIREQGVMADYVIMMGYDEHWSGGPAGSTASMPFTNDTIRMALELVPSDKLIHGIPFYTRVWGEENGVNTSSTAVGMVSAGELLEEHGADLEWLDEEGQYFGEYMEDGVKYSIWLEDITSLRQKLDAIRKAGLAGVACWKLGLEDPAVWPEITGYLN